MGHQRHEPCISPSRDILRAALTYSPYPYDSLIDLKRSPCSFGVRERMLDLSISCLDPLDGKRRRKSCIQAHEIVRPRSFGLRESQLN